MTKRKSGKPKGSRNKKNKIVIRELEQAFDYGAKIGTLRIRMPEDYQVTATKPETPTFLSRLEAATVRYEQAIKETIETLKGTN